MKLDLSTGCLVTVEQPELDRRVGEVRKMMERHGAGLFLAACPGKGGYRNYLTGTDGPGRPSEGAVLIGLTGDVILVNGGALVPRGTVGERNYAMAGGLKGDGFMGYGSCEGFSADIMEQLLGEKKVIAVANMAYLRADLYEYIKKNLQGVEIIDVSREMDGIRARKSGAELEILSSGCRMMDKLFAGAGIYINPQKAERDIATDLRYAAYRLGAGGVDHQISTPLELTSGRDGAARNEETLKYPGRKVELGDRVNLKMYSVGNDGYYAGMARSYVLGKPSGETQQLWEMAVKAQDLAVSLLKPGVLTGDVAAAVNGMLVAEGFRPDRHTMIHGIGCSVQENPQVFEEQPMPVKENMVLYVGPMADNGRGEPLACGDVYVIRKEGAVRLTEFPRELIRLY